MRTAVVLSNTVRNALAAARRVLELPQGTQPTVLNDGGDGLYRASFATGDIAEITIASRADFQAGTVSEAFLQ